MLLRKLNYQMKKNSLKKLLLSLALYVAVNPAYALKFEIPKELQVQVAAEAAAKAEEPVMDFVNAAEIQPESDATVEFEVMDAVLDAATDIDDALAADEGHITGRVVDKDTGAAVGGVAVLLEGADIGTVTDGNGEYRIRSAPAGVYTLSFIKGGYIEANVTDFAVVGGEEQEFAFALPPRPAEMSDDVYELQDFSVTAEEAISQNVALLNMRQTSIASMEAMSSEDFAKFGASDAAEAIKRISGASISDGGYVVFRGLNDRYNTTLINGVLLPSPDPDRKAVALDIFPTSLFDSIVARKTYTTDLPGESSGGSIELRTKSVPEEPFIKFSYGTGGQLTSSDTDTFLSDPEQVSLSQWIKGDDRRGFDLRSGTQELVDDYPSNVGGEGFPLTAPRIKKMSKYGDRSYNLSFGGSKEITDWLTVGGVFGMKVAENRRTGFTELYKIKIDEGKAVLDERAQRGDTRMDRDGNTVQHGGVTKSTEEYSSSILFGLGAKILDHTDLNYTYLRADTLTSTVKRIDYQQFEESAPAISGLSGLPGNEFYSYTDYEVGSEEKLLEAHQFSGEHRFEFLLPPEWTFSWYYTDAGMEQSEPDQRLIAEFIPDQFGKAISAYASDPGLPPVSRFQRETVQDSTMSGFKMEQEIKLSDSITLGFNFGYDSESSEREFRQLEARIAQDRFVDDPLFAAMPYPDQLGLNDVVDPANAVNPIFKFNDGFVDGNLENGVNEVVAALFDQAVGNADNSFTSLSGILTTRQTALNASLSSLALAQASLDSAVSSFETFTGVDFETQYDPGNPTHVFLLGGLIAPAQQNIVTGQAATDAAQNNVNTTQAQVDTAQSELNTIAAEQMQYLIDSAALINQIASMPALAMDSTSFPTFSFFGNQSYILDTPRGFSVYADETPTVSNIQFTTVDGLFQARGESEVESTYISGNLKFSKLPLIESLRVAGGFRDESTKLNYELIPNALGEPAPVSGDGAGVSPFTVTSSSIDQKDRLGYLAFVFEITKNLKLHLSASTTVAKPTFREIAPFPIFNLSDKSFEQGNGGLMLRSANAYDDWKNREGDFAGKADSELPGKFVVPVEFAGLEIAEVKSSDIRFEYYTPLDGLISIGYFTKTVGAPIERVFAYESSGVAVNTFINNNNDAKLEGIEFELQQNLGVLGGDFLGIPLRWFTIGGNYTKINAEVKRSKFEMDNLSSDRAKDGFSDPDAFQDGGNHDTRPLYDQPSFVANAFISMDIEQTSTRVTLSQNWTGEQLVRAGGISESQLGVADLYWDVYTSLNLVIEQRINDTWSLKFAVKNLDRPVRKLFEKEIFYESLNDGALYQTKGGSPTDKISDSAAGFSRTSQTIDPSYSISISATF
jgi:hypothetical protein